MYFEQHLLITELDKDKLLPITDDFGTKVFNFFVIGMSLLNIKIQQIKEKVKTLSIKVIKEL